MQQKIDFIDDHLSFNVFCEVVIPLIFVFYNITFVLRSTEFNNSYETIPFFYGIHLFILSLNYLLNFFVITLCACSVAETYSKVWSKLKQRIRYSNDNMVLLPTIYFMYTDKEAQLTLWEIMPINRILVFGTFGMIFTYVMLVDQFYSINNNL